MPLGEAASILVETKPGLCCWWVCAVLAFADVGELEMNSVLRNRGAEMSRAAGDRAKLAVLVSWPPVARPY